MEILNKLFAHELKTTSLTKEIIETLYNDRVSNPIVPSKLDISNGYTVEDFNTVAIIEDDVSDIIENFYCEYETKITELKVMVKDGSHNTSIMNTFNCLMDEYVGTLNPTLQDIINETFTLNDFMENQEYLGILYKKPAQPVNTPSLFDLPKKLTKEQKKTVKFICKKKTVQLNLGMGFGKTASTLTAISKLIKKGKVKNALIIAPKLVASNV